MTIRTIEEYSRKILDVYKEDQGGKLSGYLSNPTPSQIRDACSQIFKESMCKADQEIIEAFFGITEEENGRLIIECYETGKLKSISNFLKEKSNTTNPRRLNLVALLVDYEHRPFAKFRHLDTIDIQEIPKPILGKNEIIKDPPNPNIDNSKKWYANKKWIGVIGFVLLMPILYFNINWKQKDCMIWAEDHYKTVVCGHNGTIDITFNKDISENFKKAQLDTIQDFFKKGKPLYWYNKSGGSIELFTKDGRHPVTRKRLRPITELIIRSYILKEK